MAFDFKKEDAAKYGREVYRAFRCKGNHRWDTCVFANESGGYAAVFRHSFRKKLLRTAKSSGAMSLTMKPWWPRRMLPALSGRRSRSWPTRKS